MTDFSLVFVIAFVVLAFYLMLRPLVGPLFFKKADAEHPLPGWMSTGHETALEIAVLTSLMINFPHGAFGYGALPVLLAFTVGLAILPSLARPAIAVVLLAFGVTRLEPSALFNLFLVLVAFLVLRTTTRLVRRVFGG